MIAPTRTVPPAELPVSLDEAKAHCRVDSSDEDSLITGYLSAAVEYLDGWDGVLGRAIVTQTWRQDFGSFCSAFPLKLGPVVSVSSLSYLDADGVQQTVAAPNYEFVRSYPVPTVRPVSGYSWPALADRSAPVSITYVAGYGAASAVPWNIKAAILLLVGHWYSNRETVNVGNITSEMAFTVKSLVDAVRPGGF